MTWDVEITEYHAIANWTWDAGDDVCSICRMPFDGCPPDCKVRSHLKSLAGTANKPCTAVLLLPILLHVGMLFL